MDNYKPNSNKFKKEQQTTEKKKVEKVVNGAVKVKKKSEIRKAADVFIAEDVANVGSYIFMDVLVPALKKAFVDIVKNGVDMLIYGESSKRSNTSASRVSYGSYYNGGTRAAEPRTRTGFDFNDIIFDNRSDAEEVLISMEELIDVYGTASVGDLYDLVDITAPYTANNYGWTSLHTAKAVRVQDGWMLKLPKALPLR